MCSTKYFDSIGPIFYIKVGISHMALTPVEKKVHGSFGPWVYRSLSCVVPEVYYRSGTQQVKSVPMKPSGQKVHQGNLRVNVQHEILQFYRTDFLYKSRDFSYGVNPCRKRGPSVLGSLSCAVPEVYYRSGNLQVKSVPRKPSGQDAPRKPSGQSAARNTSILSDRFFI